MVELCVQKDINKCKIKIWKERSKTELSGISPWRRGRFALDCSASEGN